LDNCSYTVIGGENAIGNELAEMIGAYGKVSRLSGKNRFETSVLVAQKYFAETDAAVLAYAWSFPDGLCGGSLAYAMKAPLILTMTDYEAQAAEYIRSGNIGQGIVLGGEKLISDGAVRNVFAMEEDGKILVK
jgi:putative cell wall-binding protein